MKTVLIQLRSNGGLVGFTRLAPDRVADALDWNGRLFVYDGLRTSANNSQLEAFAGRERCMIFMEKTMAPVTGEVTSDPELATDKPGARCAARQHSDEMVCRPCAIRWDVNDKEPPKCLRLAR